MPASSSSRQGRRPNTALQDLWQQRLQRFEPSGLSAVAFCAQERVSTASFYAWRRRLQPQPAKHASPHARSTTDVARLIPVRVLAAAIPVELVLPGGAVLRLAPGCDLDFVRSLVATLEEQPC